MVRPFPYCIYCDHLQLARVANLASTVMQHVDLVDMESHVEKRMVYAEMAVFLVNSHHFAKQVRFQRIRLPHRNMIFLITNEVEDTFFIFK